MTGPEPPRRRVVEWADPQVVMRSGQSRPGIDLLRALLAGELPAPPALALLGIELKAVEPGVVTMDLPIGEHLYNPLGSVHGGTLATLLDSVMGCAVHSTLPAGRSYATLEIKVNYLRGVTTAVGTITAEGRVVHAGRRQAVAEARAIDAAGKLYATASTTCLVFDLPKGPSA